ncbi:uncharacterized protein Pyn_37085 [Prunus yedoensis var. nudiflora]|uniref:Pyrrolo-quinoline quinone repeat domain-containing protein n=1 Tax=Prunus yedoensis var. nudiflora TaxID=2094558 RepID=A0A314YLP3_PRUYE|nr:uncharacterized protein Pyn_37085 [Prunus yedoensis var. nudiflora]
MACKQNLMKCHHTIKMVVMVVCLLTLLDATYAIWTNHGGDITNRKERCWGSANQAKYSVKHEQNLGALTGLNGTGVVVNVTVSRSTPTIAGNLLIVGIYGPAVVIAVDRSNGRLVWSTQLDPRPRVLITMSGTVHLGAFYVGVSSLQEGLPAVQCCNFRGSVAKLDLRTGVILWWTYMLPDNVVDWEVTQELQCGEAAPPLIYPGDISTEVTKCQERQNNQRGKPTHPDQCIGSDINFNSILALDLDSGRIVWSRQLGGYDVFCFACLVPNNPDCPPGPNVDADFGEAPMLLTIHPNRTRRDVVIAVQKSGFAWALDRDNGTIVWFKANKFAGLRSWRVRVPAKEEAYGVQPQMGEECIQTLPMATRQNFTLAPSSQTTTAGAWVALDADSGEILWTTANPSNDTAQAPVTVANGVVFAGSVASNGPIYAMNASTGRILWSYNTGATVYGGISASYGCIYVGSGYSVGLAKFHLLGQLGLHSMLSALYEGNLFMKTS